MDSGSFTLQDLHLTEGDIADHKHIINKNINFRITKKKVFQTLTKQAANNSANV
jgi:hypothetical protein